MHQTFCRGRKLDKKHGGQLGNWEKMFEIRHLKWVAARTH